MLLLKVVIIVPDVVIKYAIHCLSLCNPWATLVVFNISILHVMNFHITSELSCYTTCCLFSIRIESPYGLIIDEV